ncbi:MAG: hypothetical protein ACRD8O_15790 [Bryobacteraceae bacterium]
MRVNSRAGVPLFLLIFSAALPVALSQTPATQAQTESLTDEVFEIYNEHPRLFLRPQRLRLVRRERERRSQRWQLIETFILGKVPMPEPGLADALFYRVTDDAEAGKRAVRWAAGATDLHQIALVFDWCQPLLSAADSKALVAKLEKGLAAPAADVPAMRSRTLAAIALAGHSPAAVPAIEATVKKWWRGQIVPAIKSGRNVISRDHSYPLFELLHAIRDNTNIDLRDPIPGFFKGLPVFHLLSYYPAVYDAPEGDYRIPVAKGAGEPDLQRAAMSRIAELCMVSYDLNEPGSQVLQGWLMHDRFLLRGTYGVVYEFLWANPYQPGLSYYHVPLVFHDDMFGRLFARSSWEDTATWLAYSDGEVQWFHDGRPTLIRPQLSTAPLALPEAIVVFGEYARKFKITLQDEEELFVVGLEPRQAYDIEDDDEEMYEIATDPGGIVMLKLPKQAPVGVRIHKAGAGPS